jgi:carbamoylphosphate synthase large subunit
MNVLIIYGLQWNVDCNKLLNHVQPYINNVLLFTSIDSLLLYLNKEGKNYKNHILPLSEPHILELRNANINGIMTTPEIINIFSNKKAFDQYIINNNLSEYVPKSYSYNDYSDKLVIVKPPCGGSSVGMYLSNINDLQPTIFQNYLVQEYIKEPTEFTGNLVVQDGHILYGFAYYRYYGDRNYIKHDSQDFTVQYTAPISQKYLDIFEKFLLPVKYTGVCNIDFKLCGPEEKIKVFEINPRLGGSLFFDNHYGDLATMVLKLIHLDLH